MFKKIVELSNRPKKPLTRRAVLQILGVQAVLLMLILGVVVLFPERAFALSPFVLMSLGITMMLFVEGHEGKLVAANVEVSRDEQSTP